MNTSLAPLLRGYFFDGESSVFIHTTEGKVAEVILPADIFEREIEDQIEGIHSTMDSFISENGRYPFCVSVEEEHTVYCMGSTYDEAVQEPRRFSRSLDYRGSSRRAEVMKNKISVVTGGAQGFGAGMVRGLIEEGGFVFIADMNIEGARALSDSLNNEKGKTVAYPLMVNVTDEASVQAMIDEVVSITGGFDIFVSNAGVLRAGSVKEMTLKDFDFVTSVDYTGFFLCTKHASALLSAQNAGSRGRYMSDIIAISSKSGLEGSNRNGAYAGAKFGTIGLTQSFALELISDNIKVNAVCPGNFLDGPLWSDPERGLFVQYFRANKVPGAQSIADVRAFYESKVPISRGCTTEDVMRAVCYIVEQKYETGQAVPVTGGQVMLN